MRSTILQREPILHIHSLRYYLYTLYFLTFIHVYDSCLDLWLMICESLWNTALSLSPSPSCRVAVLVSHISKLKALMGFRSSGEFLFLFFYLALRDGSWSSVYFLIVAASLTVICKVPLGKYSGLPRNTVSGLETPAGCSIKELRTPATAWTAFSSHGGICVYSIYSWMYRPCLGNVDDRYGTKTRQ